jgi:hypothetical protein
VLGKGKEVGGFEKGDSSQGKVFRMGYCRVRETESGREIISAED